jgi:hypothetical protein
MTAIESSVQYKKELEGSRSVIFSAKRQARNGHFVSFGYPEITLDLGVPGLKFKLTKWEFRAAQIFGSGFR